MLQSTMLASADIYLQVGVQACLHYKLNMGLILRLYSAEGNHAFGDPPISFYFLGKKNTETRGKGGTISEPSQSRRLHV